METKVDVMVSLYGVVVGTKVVKIIVFVVDDGIVVGKEDNDRGDVTGTVGVVEEVDEANDDIRDTVVPEEYDEGDMVIFRVVGVVVGLAVEVSFLAVVVSTMVEMNGVDVTVEGDVEGETR